ncbi:hypothetical protein GGTG_05854 [Gaeumannomyces tritici R3-111a-1]|uniref:Uncharacterized protein n=1 Tax=Gaeumannomyces tritici (strain R3-111a-1) TaxID=644352 RepID=J3NX47_GAET3|nr:hypothetical protein GGTG_05854 [Gaeumannomyces tritici R3-111a-1]EJT75929.1 hypothetical protein GGTG_05854 [Gaeumannomyces tritici R3-111a-1]
MDWANTHLEFPAEDKDSFSHEPRRSLVVRKVLSDSVPKKWELTTEEEWKQWLHEEHFHQHQTPGIGVILAARPPGAQDDAAGDDESSQIGGNDGMLLTELPFSRVAFDEIIKKFLVHPSITKAIQRPGPIFSRTHIRISNPHEPAIAYVCRTSSAWDGDIALSATHFPRTGFTSAVVFGCEFDDEAVRGNMRIPTSSLKSGDRITGLLSNSEATVAHPMLLVGILAEVELRRHQAIVRRAVEHLLDTVTKVSTGEGADYQVLAPQSGDEDKHAIKPWLDMHVIKIKLESWQRELEKMVEHVEELSQTLYQTREIPSEGDMNPTTLQPYEDTQLDAFKAEEEQRANLRATGGRIEERLRDIVNQYREMISESMLTMEGLTLATQVAHTRANMEIAEKTKKDGGQMKSIAVLTMVFLPGTFFATFFSMSFFKWDPPSEGEVASPKLWVYFLVTVVFTTLTLAIYMWWSRKQSGRVTRGDDPERGAKEDLELSLINGRTK